MYLIMAFIASIVVQAVGDVTLVLEKNKHLELKGCLYIPEYIKNLISVSSLNKSDYSIYFNKNVFIRNNDSFICWGILVDNLFHITLISLLSVVENNHVSLRRKIPNINQTYHDIYT